MIVSVPTPGYINLFSRCKSLTTKSSLINLNKSLPYLSSPQSIIIGTQQPTADSMAERKNGLDLDYEMLLGDQSDDDHIPELVIVSSSEKSKAAVDVKEFRMKTYSQLQRRRIQNQDGVKHEETIRLSAQSGDGASCRKDGSNKKSSDSSKFAKMFANKIDGNERTVNAFEKEMSLFNPRQGRKTSLNGQISIRGRSNQQPSTRLKQFQFPTTLVDKKAAHSAFSPLHFYHNSQPSTKLKPKAPTSYNLVDEEDIEDPDDSDTTSYAEKLSDSMKDVKVYYPSREDRDPVGVIYTDMECLAPEACLSSTIMNFYIRYLQQSSSENWVCNFHFFNTYFYHKLQKLNYKEDSFLKFRKWWKGVNIFEKAYILIPVHESAHWSLGIICIPTKKDESVPIVLHLDSLGLHDSSLIFDNVGRFVKEEWNHLRNSEDHSGLPITDEIWENLDHRIINRRIQVPQQRNAYDCGLFVLYYMERFIKEAPERLKEKDLSMFGNQWFPPKEASSLRWRIHKLLVQEFKTAKDNETVLSPKC